MIKRAGIIAFPLKRTFTPQQHKAFGIYSKAFLLVSRD